MYLFHKFTFAIRKSNGFWYGWKSCQMLRFARAWRYFLLHKIAFKFKASLNFTINKLIVVCYHKQMPFGTGGNRIKCHINVALVRYFLLLKQKQTFCRFVFIVILTKAFLVQRYVVSISERYNILNKKS